MSQPKARALFLFDCGDGRTMEWSVHMPEENARKLYEHARKHDPLQVLQVGYETEKGEITAYRTEVEQFHKNHATNTQFSICRGLIESWANDRMIIPRSTPVAQARKTLEEAGELLEAAARMDALEGSTDYGSDDVLQAREAYRDAVGDVLVTLIIGAALADTDILDCLLGAYMEIKDRRGTLREDGIFVKEAPAA